MIGKVSPMEFNEILQQAKSQYCNLLTDSFKSLIETKHLYQSIEVDVSDISKRIKELGGSYGMEGKIEVAFKKYISYPLDTNISKSVRLPNTGSSTSPTTVLISLPTVKIYCSKCKRIEAFNPIVDNNRGTQISITYHFVSRYPDVSHLVSSQIFILEYQCQSCKGTPHLFLIRKHGDKLSLHGRSPIEVFPSPPVIPKKFQKYFSDSVIAYNSGQVLAALFLLRTFIEQFTRAENNENQADYADDILTAYMDGLPNDFKQRFPSLKKIYGDLSAAIHKAEADESLFEKARKNVEKHFEARKLFELS